MSRIRKITAAVSVAALVGAGGISAANAASSSNDGPSGSRPAHSGPRPGGPMPAAQLNAIAKTLGVTSAQLKAALEATRPEKPARGDRPDHGAGLASELATALGVDVAQVKTILDANRPAKPTAGARKQGKPGKPDDSKLVAALASGLNIDRATVQAAFDKLATTRRAEHDARETAMYAAIAAKLGVSADAVKAALEANRPTRPAGPRP
jgi:Clp amino terminal domain, pathogenicity island component